jgi:putative flippase GtrA
MQQKDSNQIMRDFKSLQSRQLLAIGVALLLLLLLVLLYKHPGIFGEFSKKTIVTAQGIIIAAFIGFSVYNWRCPSCNKYLSADINRRICKKCGSRLQ